MLQAMDKYGNKITLFTNTYREIVNMKKNEQSFFCPICKGAVFIRSGKKVIPHFAHYPNPDCHAAEEGEGVYHERGKMLLFNWLTKQNLAVELESYIKEIKQRPDLLLHIGKKRIAIEYQCATISRELLKARTEGYRSVGIYPLWILGANQLKRKSAHKLRINTFVQSFIHQFSAQLSPRIFFFCPVANQFIIAHDIYMTSKQLAVTTLINSKLNQISFLNLFDHKIFTSEKLYTLWEQEKLIFRTKQRHKLSIQQLQWHKWLYSKNVYLYNLPSIIYLPIQSQLFMNRPLWEWQSRFVLEKLALLQIGETINIASYKRISKVNTTSEFPLTCNTFNPLYEYMLLLKQLQMFSQQSAITFRKQTDVYFPKTIDEAIIADRHLLHRLKQQKISMFLPK